MPGKGGENPIFIVSADYPPLWRLVGCRRPPEIKLDVGVFWGDSELLLIGVVKSGRHDSPHIYGNRP